jgi:hypothetical protein
MMEPSKIRTLRTATASLSRLNQDHVHIQERYSLQKAPARYNPDRVPTRSVALTKQRDEDFVPCASCPKGGARVASKFVKGSTFAIHDDNCTAINFEQSAAIKRIEKDARSVKFKKATAFVTRTPHYRGRSPESTFSSSKIARGEGKMKIGENDNWKDVFVSTNDSETNNDAVHQGTIQHIRKHPMAMISRIHNFAYEPALTGEY